MQGTVPKFCAGNEVAEQTCFENSLLDPHIAASHIRFGARPTDHTSLSRSQSISRARIQVKVPARLPSLGDDSAELVVMPLALDADLRRKTASS